MFSRHREMFQSCNQGACGKQGCAELIVRGRSGLVFLSFGKAEGGGRNKETVVTGGEAQGGQAHFFREKQVDDHEREFGTHKDLHLVL